MAAVRLKNLSLALEIPDRALAVLTGPAGCGKTMLLRLIAGLEKTSEGEVFLGEKRVSDLPPSERDVAMVFSEDALYPRLSIRENIAFGLKRRKFSQTETSRRVEDAAAVLGIAELLGRRPTELSAVQRQRASIARAIARQPKVVLLDEPWANFDAATSALMRADLRKLHERLEATMIYATRDASEAMALGERIVVLREDRVEQEGSLGEVYERPANLFVAGFLGAPPMNFIHGTLKLEREALLFREANEGTIEVRLPLAGRAAAAELVGKPVVLGIRPENVEIVPAGKGQEPPDSFAALLDFTEMTSGGVTLHLQTGAHTVIARLSGGREEPAGRRSRFRFEAEKVHLFDLDSTRRMMEA